MRKISREEINQILINHLHWIKADCDGWEDMRANLCGANLCGANLCGANLHGADLCGANLCEANLCEANLCGANLCEANLCEANLREANLCEANLHGANLFGANLCEANLCEANLCGANLCGANLCGTYLHGAEHIPYIPTACPGSGAFTAWKKAHGYIVKLYIPSDARRCSATGRKCRCDKAIVIGIENLDGTTADITEVASSYDPSFKYVLHGLVAVDNFCKDRWEECSAGIHFFVNREEAVNYI